MNDINLKMQRQFINKLWPNYKDDITKYIHHGTVKKMPNVGISWAFITIIEDMQKK